MQFWATTGGRTATCRPLPPPPRPSLIGRASPVVCPYGPSGLTGQQRRTREPSRAGPRAGKHSARPGTPPPATSAPGLGVWDLASTAAPLVPTGSQGARALPSRARRTPVPVRTQSWDRRAVCLCDQEDAMPWPTTPRWAQRLAPMASPPGLEHQATLAPHAQGPAPPPSPRTPARRRAHPPTRARALIGGQASVVVWARRGVSV